VKKGLIIALVVILIVIAILAVGIYALDIDFLSLFETSDSGRPTTRIKLDTYEATMQVGETIQLEASAKKQTVLHWKSSNEDVVIVNSKGVVTAVAPGVANITCYASYATEASCTVTVEAGFAEDPQKPIELPDISVPDTPSKPSTPSAPSTENSDFIFPYSSVTYLTLNEAHARLSVMTGSPLSGSFAQDAVNEIYARNGYVFQSPELSSYYNAQHWYVPNPSFDFGSLNQYEVANIQLLQSLN